MLFPERFKYKLKTPSDIIHEPHWYKAKQKESRIGYVYQIPSDTIEQFQDDQHVDCKICSYTPLKETENIIKKLRKTITIKERDIGKHGGFFANLSSSGILDDNFDVEDESESSDDEYFDLVNVKERILNWLPEECIEDKIKTKDHYYRVEYKDIDGTIKEKIDHFKNLEVYEIERLFRKFIK